MKKFSLAGASQQVIVVVERQAKNPQEKRILSPSTGK